MSAYQPPSRAVPREDSCENPEPPPRKAVFAFRPRRLWRMDGQHVYRERAGWVWWRRVQLEWNRGCRRYLAWASDNQ